MSRDFLVEIGTEELPPKSLNVLATAFAELIHQQLTSAGLAFGEVAHYASPRRLAVFVANLDENTPEEKTVIWGPPVKVAFDADGNPTRAAQAFAGKNQLDIDALKDLVESDGKQDKLCYRSVSPGRPTEGLLGNMVETALAGLPIPKRMRWGARRDEFVRPVHWLVMLFGNRVVQTTIMGFPAGNRSRGHRFHSPGEVVIESPASYKEDLRKAFVIADLQERRELIRDGVTRVAEQSGGRAVIGENLLDEVTALCEWPVPLVGEFDERFLDVPPEALISTMAVHQKYFHVVDKAGKLKPLFVAVANIDSKDPGQVKAGNEKVIRPRLADAAFFYETDLKSSLAQRREQLKSIVFQASLGSLYDKTERVATLAEFLAPLVGADPARARRAGEIGKSDLVSEMVGEFDDLQGIMGRYYALNDGEDPEVAEAMLEQYLPAFAGDRIPATATGTTLALADRIDTLVGIFGIGQPPTGSRDPFALRRASLGVLRIIVEREIDLDLREVLGIAAAGYGDLPQADSVVEQVLTYMIDRFRAWYEDENIPAEVFMAVAAKGLGNPLDIHQRVQAVHSFSQLPQAPHLAAANKRVSHILAKSSDKLNNAILTPLLKDQAERALSSQLDIVIAEVAPLINDRRYTEAMAKMAVLRDPVDAFFDQVMVNVEEEDIRCNRLTLLKSLHNLFLNVADISLLVPAKQ